jgi:hypothetical protein
LVNLFGFSEPFLLRLGRLAVRDIDLSPEPEGSARVGGSTTSWMVGTTGAPLEDGVDEDLAEVLPRLPLSLPRLLPDSRLARAST